jgi:hypothetical protein
MPETGDEKFFTPSVTAFIIMFVFIAVYAAYVWYMGRNTVPVPPYMIGFRDVPVPGGDKPSKGIMQGALEASEFFENPPGSNKKEEKAKSTGPITEGFYGGAARGAGTPDCLRTSSEAAALVALFKNDGRDSYRELNTLMGKLACFKKDLLSPSYMVDATRGQEFVTMHDIEPVAETTGRCFAKTISPRDLELSLDKWAQRGELLVKRLSASQMVSPAEADKAEELFRVVVRDVKDVARSSCLSGEPTIAGKPGPRDPHPYEMPSLKDLGTYCGFY